MRVVVKPGKEASTEAAINSLSAVAREEITDVIDVLVNAISLQEAKEVLLGDMVLEGNGFSVSIRENFQFVVAGLLGESEGNEMLLIEVIHYG
ncbi:hypothetical protein SAMN06297280_2470 [Arsukibacterium tuosuense]|uniref:Uncharacterized protein n=1 Tax=Arsukibacterium tuosuense TaxID=1323745 RepID=A0A285J0W8_9GAMM|nr:hypothetical protein [Arsukibacterium tuosuense]SNY53842.1 hypothetical protein SAMN06297280_2470 [Arsukibacterium tuosuense]